MKIEAKNMQQCFKGIELKQNKALDGQDISFQGIMLQIISMMNMSASGEQGDGCNLAQNKDILNIKNSQPEILMDTISNLNIEDFKPNQVNQELLEIVEKRAINQDGKLSEEQVANIQNHDELNKILKKIDSPLGKLLMELNAPIDPYEEEEAETLDINKTTKINSFIQEKEEETGDNQKTIKIITKNESLSKEKPKGTKETLTENKSSDELGTKSTERAKKPYEKDISTNNHGLSFNKIIVPANKIQQQVEIQNIHEISKKMIKEIKILKNGEQSNLQLRLKPKELGEVEIKLEMKEGKVLGKILVESMAVKGAIENQMQHLKEQLRIQDILIKDIEVDLQQHSRGEHQDNKHSFLWNDETFPGKSIKHALKGNEDVVNVKYAQRSLVVNSYYSGGQASSLNLLA